MHGAWSKHFKSGEGCSLIEFIHQRQSAMILYCLCRYLSGFCSGFDEGLSDVQVLFMQSDGGLARVDDFCGHKAVLSGPAGGYVGYAELTKWEGIDPMTLQV